MLEWNRIYAWVAQQVEQWTENPRRVGSIPTPGTSQIVSIMTITQLSDSLERQTLIYETEDIAYDCL